MQNTSYTTSLSSLFVWHPCNKKTTNWASHPMTGVIGSSNPCKPDQDQPAVNKRWMDSKCSFMRPLWQWEIRTGGNSQLVYWGYDVTSNRKEEELQKTELASVTSRSNKCYVYIIKFTSYWRFILHCRKTNQNCWVLFSVLCDDVVSLSLTTHSMSRFTWGVVFSIWPNVNTSPLAAERHCDVNRVPILNRYRGNKCNAKSSNT